MLWALGAPSAMAQVDSAEVSEPKTLLILNSYNEYAPWSKSVIAPINYYTAQNEDLSAEIVHFNSTLITDSATYFKVQESVMNEFADSHVDYVVFIGNLAFTMRKAIKDRWGDIPMLLITRDLSLAPTQYYFSGFDRPSDFSAFPLVSDLRPEYNFTVVYVADMYKETIDLMMRLIPDMDEFVFFSDGVYFNRYLSRQVENYLITEYPHIKFTWAKATYETSDLLQRYFVKRRPNTGLLLSSWFYETMGALGYPNVTSGEMSLLGSTINPVFSLREAYMDMGSVGGVYADMDGIAKVIIRDLESMVNGENMRDINFYLEREDKTTMLNYPLLKEYGLADVKLPSNVTYINKPLTFWEKYHWQTIIALLIVAFCIYLLARRNMVQRHQIETLSRHKQFVDHMPIPFTKAKVIYNDYMNAILNIKYTMTNQAFDELIRENSDPKQSYLLFSPEFISEKTTEMLESGRPISFLHHFKKSDKYYMFTLCLVDSSRKKSKDVIDNIDIFAIDVTSRVKSEESLKSITKRLDMTIDVANLIPWEWDTRTDKMMFDAYSMFQRLKRSFDDGHLTKGQSVVSTSEFMKLIYPEDREIMRSVREQLLSGEITEFDVQYRLVIARQNKEHLEWVDVRGSVTDTDENGMPLHVMGSMIVITERKEQEFAIMEAQRKTAQAEGLKSSFVNSLSHEVRIQLNAIVGFASLMNETDDAKKRQEFADIINDNTNQLLKYMDDLVVDAMPDSSNPPATFRDEVRNMHSALGLRSKQPKDQEKPAEEKPSETPVQQHPADQHPAEQHPAEQPGVEDKPSEAEKPAETPAASEASKPAKDKTKKLILVAEDIEGNFLLLKHYIPKKYDIIHAWTGKEALDMFHKHHPDIILMDIGMPVMDGYKATSEIRKVDAEVPIVAVTAYTSNSDRELILHSGFDDYVSKPVMRGTIIDTLKHYLEN